MKKKLLVISASLMLSLVAVSCGSGDNSDDTSNFILFQEYSPSRYFGDYGDLYMVREDGMKLRVIADMPIPVAADPEYSPDGRYIAFSARIDGDRYTEIYIMNANGTNIRQITNNGGSYSPTWSPDGKKIAFVSKERGAWRIHSINIDGTEQQLLGISGDSRHPSWTPDGNHIVFQYRSDGSAIYIMKADGTGAEQLLETTEIHVEGQVVLSFDRTPIVSPNGKHIVFLSNRNLANVRAYQIYVMNSDGTEPRLIGSGNSPSWSPDSKSIVFEQNNTLYTIKIDGTEDRVKIGEGLLPTYSPKPKATLDEFESFDNIIIYHVKGRNKGRDDIYTFDLNGFATNIRRLTNSQHDSGNTSPSWDSFSERIVFSSTRESDSEYCDDNVCDSEIYSMLIDGTDVQVLTRNEVADLYPSVSPKESIIAFLSNRNETWGLYTMNIDGSNLELLVNLDSSIYRLLVWSPDGKKLAYIHERMLNTIDLSSKEIQMIAENVSSFDWSSDSKQMTFSSGRDIYTVRSDGSGMKLIGEGSVPKWSPDGQHIAFSNEYENPDDSRDDDDEVFIMRSDGSNILRLTDDYTDNQVFGWTPEGDHIIFNVLADLAIVRKDGEQYRELTYVGYSSIITWNK